jgi:hypothetical protein
VGGWHGAVGRGDRDQRAELDTVARRRHIIDDHDRNQRYPAAGSSTLHHDFSVHRISERHHCTANPDAVHHDAAACHIDHPTRHRHHTTGHVADNNDVHDARLRRRAGDGGWLLRSVRGRHSRCRIDRQPDGTWLSGRRGERRVGGLRGERSERAVIFEQGPVDRSDKLVRDRPSGRRPGRDPKWIWHYTEPGDCGQRPD